MKSQKQCLALEVKVAQLCPTLCDPMDYTIHGILQARILEWVAFPFSRESSQPRDWMSPWKCSINIDHSHCLVVVAVQLLSRVQPLRPHGLQHSRLPCPPLSPRVCSNSCPYNTELFSPKLRGKYLLFGRFVCLLPLILFNYVFISASNHEYLFCPLGHNPCIALFFDNETFYLLQARSRGR